VRRLWAFLRRPLHWPGVEARGWLLLVAGWLAVGFGLSGWLGWPVFVITVGLLLLGLTGWRVVAGLVWFGTLAEPKDEPPQEVTGQRITEIGGKAQRRRIIHG
jgi:hypothetical protein